ncbi:phage baseplate upper protein [Bacillus anthracis]|nr:phage baseplate upper protein [Bacillus anthracis]
MRNETIIIDLSSPSLAKTIYSRQNDKNGLKLTVYLREYGKPVDLTGYAVKYEAAGQSSNFVRVDAKVIDAAKGIFEYIFSKEAVSTSSLWLAYFAFEKGEERFTTQDLKIVLGSDVKQGNIPIENYIAEFDKLKKQIDALQVAVDKADVVKRSGGTMVGNLIMDATVGGESRVLFQTGPTGTDQVGFRHIVSNNTTAFRDYRRGLSVWDWNGSVFNVYADTNLVKKTGDVMTGDLTVQKNSPAINLTVPDGSKSARIFYNAGNTVDYGLQIITPTGKAFLRTTGESEVREIATKDKDTDWTNLTLINGVTNQSGKTSRIKRTGNTVCLNMNVIGVKNNHIIASFQRISDL